MPAEMFATNTLADNLIKYHDGPSNNQIMDDNNLAMLQRFVNDPNQRDTILRDAGVPDVPIEAQPQAVTSLAAYIVLKHGNGDLLSQAEVEKLRAWFASGDVFR